MSPAATVAMIFIIVFIIGVIVGAVSVIAMAAARHYRRDAIPPDEPPGPDDRLARDHNGYTYGIPGHWDSALTDDPDPRPRWPRGDDA